MKKLLFTTTLLVSLLAPNQNAITKEPNNHLNKQLIAGGTVATCALASTIYFFYKANSYKKQLLKRPTLTIEEEIKFEKKLKLYKQLAIASGIMAVGGLVIGTYEVWQGKQEKTDQESNSYEEPKQEDQTSGLTPEQIAQIKRALIDVDLGDGQSHIRKKTSRKKREEDQTPTPPSTPENADSPESS
ncbi:MAG: hypothetical protein KAU22_07520, partial [Desulfuromonadales bacterium]|nr:hypothetical protein [Desulfuromonadales bacterium]